MIWVRLIFLYLVSGLPGVKRQDFWSQTGVCTYLGLPTCPDRQDFLLPEVTGFFVAAAGSQNPTFWQLRLGLVFLKFPRASLGTEIPLDHLPKMSGCSP